MTVDEQQPPPRGELDELLGVIDHLPAMVAYWDRDRRNRVANRAYLDWFGITPEELHGRHIRDLLGPELYAKNLPYIEAVLDGEAQEFQRTLVDASGAIRYTQASYVPDWADGTVRGFHVLVTDVSARVRAERDAALSSDRYRALVRSVPGGFVLLFDSDLRFLVADGETLELFGYAREQLEGRTIHEAFPAGLAAELEPRYHAALAGQSVSWQRDIGHRVFSLRAGPVREGDGAINAGMVICTEITEQRRNEAIAAALRDVARLVADHATPAAVAGSVTTYLRNLFNLELAMVFRFDPSGTVGLLAIDPPLPDGGAEVTVVPGDQTATGTVFRTGRAAAVNYGTRPPQNPPFRGRGLQAGAAVPIHVNGRLWGTVATASTDPERAGPEMLERLESFADLVQLAIGNAEAWQTLTHQATTDAVTGLPNRQWFDRSLAHEIARAQRHGRPLSLVLFDLDSFKRVNDEHGHPMGDRVLHELGVRLSAQARRSETVARIGGEEFAWILAETGGEDAFGAADQVRAAIASEPFAGVGSLTVSAGVSTLGAGGTGERLIAEADAAMYEAKRDGRNRTVLFGPRFLPGIGADPPVRHGSEPPTPQRR